MDIEEGNEDWQVLCETSLLKNHLGTFQKICQDEYKGNDNEFLKCYLKPFVMMLDSMRTAVELHNSQIEKDNSESPWIEKYERLVKFVIHPTALKISLHKGDFYLHLSSTLPRKLQLKFYDSGTTQSKTLATDDCIYMCSEEWADNLRKEAKNRFIFSNCIIWSGRGLERKPWRSILTSSSVATEFKTQQSFLREESLEINLEAKNTLLQQLNDKPLHILEIDFEILHSQVVYLPGTRDKRGGAVMIVKSNDSCWENPDISSTELAKLFMYYFRIPRVEVQQLGCSIVIDARQGKQIRNILECVGEAIELFQEKVPNAVHMAYVITRKDSLLLMIAAGKIREKLNFEFQLLRSVQSLYQYIPQENFPVEFGGTLVYNHEKWIKFRTNLEPFMTGCRSAAKHAMTSIKELSDVKLGKTIKECRAFLEQHSLISQRVLEDSRLVNLRDEGKKILERLQEPVDDPLTDVPKTMDYTDTVECVHSLYEQMNTLFDTFQRFSMEKTKKLELQLQYVTFEVESEKISNWFQNEGTPFLNSHTDIGDSIGHVASLQAEFSHFEATAKEFTEQATNVVQIGKTVLNSTKLSDGEKPMVKDRLENLQNENDDFLLNIENRKKKLSQAINFHTLYEKASDWSLQCLRYIAQMNMEDLQTAEGAEKLENELKEFLTKNTSLEEKEMARMTELAHHLESEKLKMQAGQISARCAEVEEMINKKFNTIRAAEKRLEALANCETSESSSGIGSKDDDLSTECGDENDDGVGPSFSWKNDSGRGYEENDDLIVAFDALISHKNRERLRYIAEEMINTEKDYVAALEYILNNYIPEMDKPYLPPTLAGKKNILFGNIGRIYDFHKRYFSQELENYQHSPLQVGKCFLRWERQFYVYAMYNKNKPKCDALLDDFGNAYFSAKQKDLGDKLNLASYLIKPVQRLGKYALLLRDMANCCTANDPRLAELLAAQDMIKFQLRHGNDLLAMDSIREADVNLKEQGCLLRQGDFSVWTGKKKHLRRVFLFEDLILFAKAKKQTVKGDCFMCKGSLKTADVGLTENIGDSGLRFELWYRRWRKSKKTESYVLQASSNEIKNAWVADIRRLLMNQAQRNKEYGRSEITTGISVESQPSGLYSEHSNTSYSSPATLITTRSKTESHPKSESQPTNQNKRLSWVSSDSANTSGVHDLNYNTENESSTNEDRLPKRTAIRTSQSFTSMKKPSNVMYDDRKLIGVSNTANALVDMPVRRRLRDSESDTSFLRNAIHRRTLHIDSAIEDKYRSSQEKHSYVARTQSSPPSDNKAIEKYHPLASTQEILDETEEETTEYSSEDNLKENQDIDTVDIGKHPIEPLTPLLDAPSTPPFISSPISAQIESSSIDEMLHRPSGSFSLSTSPCSASKESVSSQQKEKKSKEKTKEKTKKTGKKISLGALMGKKKKYSSTSSEDGKTP